jgi:hypothetical protein
MDLRLCFLAEHRPCRLDFENGPGEGVDLIHPQKWRKAHKPSILRETPNSP